MATGDTRALPARLADLERQVEDTRALLRQSRPLQISSSSSLHNLLLLADSALPLGSFAYSSGLESFLAHHKNHGNPILLFDSFLKLSLQTIAYTNIPYMLACFRHPSLLAELDNDLDASTPCTVARRASIAQGRALLSVWEKAFVTSLLNCAENSASVAVLQTFARDLKISSILPEPATYGHLAPLWGAITRTSGLSLEEAGYVFLLNHAKAIISAGVRASVMGPYQAQAFLAGQDLQMLIKQCLGKVWSLQPEDAGQVVPIMDLWIGRHELLYSRIFNS